MNTDPLTKAYNRNILNSIKTTNLKSALVMIDIDHFKKVNDTYGHDVGDIILKELSSLVLNNIREQDMLIRLGGEEFLIILNNIDKKHILSKIEYLQNLIRKKEFDIGDNKKLKITVSIGVNLTPYKSKNIIEAIKKADEALYFVKKHGRNNYKVYEK